MRKLYIIIITLLCISLSACIDEKEMENTHAGNLEALWKIVDEHYCFLDLKKAQYGVDWDEVHTRYQRQVNPNMTSAQLFEVCCNMLSELRDGHVNLSSSWDYGRYWAWKEDYPVNYSDVTERLYLGTDYMMSCGMQYRILDDNIAYLRVPTFDISIGNGNLDEILYYFAPCNGLIIDVRSNGGGEMRQAEILAARFTNERRLVGYMQHKNGPGHNDFSEMREQWIEPSNRFRWQKKVVVLTNRGVFSAANEFVKYMLACGATTVGDNTGGGAGMPFSSKLPNGWGVRFSACPMFDHNKQSTEQGIPPTHRISMTDLDLAKGKDTIIEYARQIINH